MSFRIRARPAYVLGVRPHLPLFLAVLALYACGCEREPHEGAPCGGCVGGGTYKSYGEWPSSGGGATSYSRQVEAIDGGVSISEAHDSFDHGLVQLGADGLHGTDLTVAYASPTTPGTFRLDDLGAVVTTSLMSERAFGTHVVSEDGDVSVRFCTGHPTFCTGDPLVGGTWDVSLSGRRIVTGAFHSTPGHEHLSCY